MTGNNGPELNELEMPAEENGDSDAEVMSDASGISSQATCELLERL